MALKGDAKRDYMREYMKRKRAEKAKPASKGKVANDSAALAAARAEIKRLKAALAKAKTKRG
jgi:hypothetical protein